jgi:general stress protein 26
MITATEDKLGELLADFESAMLVTRTAAGELRSRPMAVAVDDRRKVAELWNEAWKVR